MDFRFDFRNWHFHIGLSRSARVRGVNSKLKDGSHFLLWDFDDKSFEEVERSLVEVQDRFQLSDIYVLNTGLDRFWHAYCFKRVTFSEAIYILASTKGLDKMFLRIGVMREFFTLRITPKAGRVIRRHRVLSSPIPPDCDPSDVESMVSYWTKRL